MKRITKCIKSTQNDAKFKQREKKQSMFVAQPVKWMSLKDSKLSVRITNVYLYLPDTSF